MIPAMPGTRKEMKDVNILVDEITEEALKLSIPAKRRHTIQSDSVNPGERNSAQPQSNKKEPWYPISI